MVRNQLLSYPWDWPEGYRRVVERRIAVITSSDAIALIEQPEYKRRWNTERWELLQQEALRQWMLARISDARFWLTYELEELCESRGRCPFRCGVSGDC